MSRLLWDGGGGASSGMEGESLLWDGGGGASSVIEGGRAFSGMVWEVPPL